MDLDLHLMYLGRRFQLHGRMQVSREARQQRLVQHGEQAAKLGRLDLRSGVDGRGVRSTHKAAAADDDAAWRRRVWAQGLGRDGRE